ncbi:MAG: hypothetical protein A2086_06655 [Spirochaetes bacterium GWD1_27_9]|nr:MAG: hypothetical protein A2Z98_00510 [Spirochaetes bacterium GWB1_27_13]OHD20049.1 MAG: hypothetical protein A2Y34_08065 [Spirochaetes bacterium GWC1_27_15]OHD41319.1 MAG: hypothetical protein A2086_06655 [Spirochaetes bacterium GWD1_27_9]
MKRIMFIIFILSVLSLLTYANERKVTISTNENTISFVKLLDSSDNGILQERITKLKKTEKTGKKKISELKDPQQLIKLGQSLTFTGVASIAIGGTFLGLGAIFALLAFQRTGSGWSVDNIWSHISSKLDDPGVVGFAAGAIFFFSCGGILMLLSALLIPGIIIWAAGASARKKQLTIAPYADSNSMGLSIKF